MVVVACSRSSTEDFGLALRVSMAITIEKGAAGASIIALELRASWNTEDGSSKRPW